MKPTPIVLTCGCTLGPRVELCAVGEQLQERKAYWYRVSVATPDDWGARTNHATAREKLEAHLAENGAYDRAQSGYSRVH